MIAIHRPLTHCDMMSRKTVDQICSTFAGATASDPTIELDSWKVGGKMFACFGDKIDSVSVKTDSVETATMLIDAGVATKARYFHKSWVTLPFGADGDETRHRLGVSYDIIVKSLPKKNRPQA